MLNSLMVDTELLTVSQAAEALSASSQTIRNWSAGGKSVIARPCGASGVFG
jgi:hypothetical protein